MRVLLIFLILSVYFPALIFSESNLKIDVKKIPAIKVNYKYVLDVSNLYKKKRSLLNFTFSSDGSFLISWDESSNRNVNNNLFVWDTNNWTLKKELILSKDYHIASLLVFDESLILEKEEKYYKISIKSGEISEYALQENEFLTNHGELRKITSWQNKHQVSFNFINSSYYNSTFSLKRKSDSKTLVELDTGDFNPTCFTQNEDFLFFESSGRLSKFANKYEPPSIWSLETNSDSHSLTQLLSKGKFVGLIPGKNHVVTLYKNSTVFIEDYISNNMVFKFKYNGMQNANISNNGQYIAIASLSNQILLYDVQQNSLSVLTSHTDGSARAVFSPDSKWLVTGGGIKDSRILIWNVADLNQSL